MANAAAFNTAHTTTCVDTQGYETNMYVLLMSTAAVTDNYVFTLNETDVSATDLGTACGVGDVITVVDDNDATIKAKISTAGVLTTTAASDNAHAYLFEYLGTKRWIKLVASVGSVSIPMSLFTIQGSERHGPYYSP
jgi:hypothetical protein